MTEEQRIKKRDYMRVYNKKNKELIAAKMRAYRRNFPKRSRAANKRAYEKYREIRLAYHRDLYHSNQRANIQRAREYRASLPKELKRLRAIHSTYGLSAEAYYAMRMTQEESCAICKSYLSEDNRQTHVDHCHETGRIRGLLCADCNVGLGRFKDSPEALRRAARYISDFLANVADEERR